MPCCGACFCAVELDGRGQPQPEPKTAVLYLSTPLQKDIKELKLYNTKLYDNFNAQFGYPPVWVFHEGDFSDELKRELVEYIPEMNVQIKFAPLGPPEGIDLSGMANNRWKNRPRPFGYINMIRFWVRGVYYLVRTP